MPHSPIIKTIDRGQNEISYDGNYVPFVPKHTLNVGGQYIFRIAPRHWLDHVQVNVNYNGAGRIYWTGEEYREPSLLRHAERTYQLPERTWTD